MNKIRVYTNKDEQGNKTISPEGMVETVDLLTIYKEREELFWKALNESANPMEMHFALADFKAALTTIEENLRALVTVNQYKPRESSHA